MKLFLASVDSAPYANLYEHNNYLISYFYINTEKKLQNNVKQHTQNANILLDSGAYSAWKKDITIKVDDYIKFVDENKDKLWHYVELDVKATDTISVADSIKLTKLNQTIMESADLTPVPVFHANSLVSSEREVALKYLDE